MLAPVRRRGFLGLLASVGGALLGPVPLLGAAAHPDTGPAGESGGAWDLSWLDALKGKHRQVFDVQTLPGQVPLIVVHNWLAAHKEVFGLEPAELSAIVAIAATYPVNAVDSLWAKYELGRRWQLKDPQTGDWATRNIYLDHMPVGNAETGVRPLQARGVVFWQCNNALNAVVHQLSEDTKQKVGDVRAELLAGLNPGVRLVPAHTMLLGLAQEHGFAYEQIG